MRKLWIEIRSSLWFVPGALVLAAIILGLGSAPVAPGHSPDAAQLADHP